MANTKSTQHEIDLTGSLNLNKFKADIKPYEGFNERNAPYYGGCLSPLYIKDDGSVDECVKYIDGVRWHTDAGYLWKDGEQIMPSGGISFKKTRVSSLYGLSKDYYITIYNFYDENNFVAYSEPYGKVIIMHNGVLTPITGKYLDSIFLNDTDVSCAVTVQYDGSGSLSYVGCYYSIPNNSTLQFIEKTVGSWGILDRPYLGLTTRFLQVNTTYIDKTNGQEVGASVVVSYKTWKLNGTTLTKDETGINYLYNIETAFSTITETEFYIPILYLGRARVNSSAIIAYRDTFGCGMTRGSLQSSTLTKITIDVNTTRLGLDGKVLPFNQALEAHISIYNNKGIFCGALFNPADENKKIMVTPEVDAWDVGYSIFEDTLNSTEYMTGPENLIETAFIYWHIFYTNEGQITGIAYGSTVNVDEHTLLTSWGSIGSTVNAVNRNKLSYYDNDLSDWVILETYNTTKVPFQQIGDYIVLNTTIIKNCYNTKTDRVEHWGGTLVNCFQSGSVLSAPGTVTQGVVYFQNFPLVNSSYRSYKLAAGQNVNWLKPELSSIKASPFIVYFNGIKHIISRKEYSYVDLYIDDKYYYSIRGDTEEYVDDNLIGTTYPGDAVRYNLPLLFDVQQGVLDTTIVNFGSNVSFFTIYYDNRQRYQYYSSSITEFEQFFIIQAQAYGIKDKKIYYVNYLNNTIQASQAVVSIEGLQFVGNTIYNAYFYSPTTKAIYSFGADNNLVVFAQADTFDGITGSSYLPGTSSIILGTPDCAYVLNEKFGIYRLNDIKNLRYASQKPDSVVLVLDDHAYEISYIDRDITEDWEKIDIVCDTAFYGAGSNVVSVNDCWYIRITDPDHKAGEIKLAVSTLTDIGRSTETRTFKVKESDWDELTDTIYIRFQPKLQRAVGVSLHIESPFKIGYIGVGATPETLQLNKGTI